MYGTSGHLKYYAESMFPLMEMDEHRADWQKLQARLDELEKQLADYAKKTPGVWRRMNEGSSRRIVRRDLLIQSGLHPLLRQQTEPERCRSTTHVVSG